MEIVSKVKGYTAWALPNHGYHDSEVIVTFSGGTEEEQREEMVKMQQDLATRNMWVYDPKLLSANVWRITYGYDSGD